MDKGQGKGTDTLQTDNVFTRKEYIEREAAKSKSFRYRLSNGELSPPVVFASSLDAIPAADVVKVVRCGECANKFDWPWCGMFPDDGYCSAGVRKGGDGDV